MIKFLFYLIELNIICLKNREIIYIAYFKKFLNYFLFLKKFKYFLFL
jgi:hypothetical protein